MTRRSLPSRRRSSTDGERGLGILAVLLAVVLISTLGVVVHDDSHVVDLGESLPLDSTYNGVPHEVSLPGATVTVQVGTPVEEVARAQVDLDDDPSDTGPVRASAGARLVPVSWSRQGAVAGHQDEDSKPVDVTLVADGEEIDVSPEEAAYPGAPSESWARIVAVDQDVEHSDLTLEVTYDGATQVLDPARGKIDTGDAEGIDEATAAIGTGCEDPSDQCHLTARGAPWRPSSDTSTFTAGAVELKAYDDELGWAGSGRRWASVSIRLPSTLAVENTDGDHRGVDGLGRLEASLDGEPAERTSGLGRVDPSDGRQGEAVFAVDAGSPPEELVLQHDLTLEGAERPRTVTVRQEIELDARS